MHPDPAAEFGDRWRTLATVIVDPAARRMTLHSNGPCGGVQAVPLHAASV